MQITKSSPPLHKEFLPFLISCFANGDCKKLPYKSPTKTIPNRMITNRVMRAFDKPV